MKKTTRTESDFLLNPKMVALAIDFSVFSIIHSWGTVSGAGGFAEPVTDICASVWIKLLSLTGKHSKLSFIFLKNKQKRCYLCIWIPFLDSWFHRYKNQKNPIPKPTSHEYVPYAHHWPLFAAIHFHPSNPTVLRTTPAVASHDWPWGSYSS